MNESSKVFRSYQASAIDKSTTYAYGHIDELIGKVVSM